MTVGRRAPPRDTPAAAAPALLYRLIGADPAVVVVTGRDRGAAGGLPELPADRRVVCAGATARLWTAEGLALAGRRPVTVLDAAAGDVVSLRGLRRPQVLLTGDPRPARAALDAGLVLVQPAWAGDVEALLQAALTAAEPVCLRLHDVPAPDPSAGRTGPPQPACLGVTRLLRRGDAALLAASGPLVPLLARVARMLAGRGVDVTAADLHTLRGPGPGPPHTDGALLLGDVAALQGTPGLDGAALSSVPVGSGDPRAVMDAVLSRLRARPGETG